jgi:hypothetical protein
LWGREAAIIAVGLLMLAIGGLLGYLVGHSNAKVRRELVAGGRPRTVVVAHGTQTVTTTNTVTPAVSVHHKTVVRTQTVTTPAKTRSVTTPAKTVTAPAHTVTIRQAPKVIHSTTTLTVTHTATSTVTTTTGSSSSPATSAPQTFNGSDNQSLGTIHVPAAAQLKWSCPGCGSATFAITNSTADPQPLSVQAQDTTSGQSSVPAGTYTSVTVQATGSWSFTLSAASG